MWIPIPGSVYILRQPGTSPDNGHFFSIRQHSRIDALPARFPYIIVHKLLVSIQVLRRLLFRIKVPDLLDPFPQILRIIRPQIMTAHLLVRQRFLLFPLPYTFPGLRIINCAFLILHPLIKRPVFLLHCLRKL